MTPIKSYESEHRTLRQNPWVYSYSHTHTLTLLWTIKQRTHCQLSTAYAPRPWSLCPIAQVASEANVPVSTGPRVPTPETPERGHTASCHTVANHRRTHRNRGTLIHTRPLFRAGILNSLWITRLIIWNLVIHLNDHKCTWPLCYICRLGVFQRQLCTNCFCYECRSTRADSW